MTIIVKIMDRKLLVMCFLCERASFRPYQHTEMSDSPDARSLLSASSQLNLMEVDAVRAC